MIISILGATGYVGRYVIKHFEETAPHIRLRLTGRNRTKLDRLAQRPSVESVHTYAHGDSFDDILRGADACIDLTYNVQGIPSEVIIAARRHAQSLVRTASDMSLARVVITGSIGVYGEPIIQHPWSSAPAPKALRPNTMYGKSKTIVEQTAATTAGCTKIPVALVRAGHVFGPGSAMASGIAGRLLNCTPALLRHAGAPSNATTVQGLAHTLAQLAIEGFGDDVFSCNHVDLEAITYDALVGHIAHAIRIHPVTGMGTAVPEKSSNTNRLRKCLQANKKKILMTQSSLGQFDGGLSASIVRLLKHRVGGDADNAGASATNQAAAGLSALYASASVPHSNGPCGPAIASSGLGATLAPVDRWLASTGFSPN